MEDLFTVLALMTLPALASTRGDGSFDPGAFAGQAGIAMAKMAALLLVLVGIGRRVLPALLGYVAGTRSREMFTLAVLALALGVAVGSAQFFGVSMALGAFLGGLVAGQSPVSHRAASDAMPMRDAFAVLFFVSVGMLLDPAVLTRQPGLFVGVLAIVLVGKPLVALLFVRLLGLPLRTGLTVAVGLAQIGEFSFILAGSATSLGLIPPDGYSLLVAVSLVSISVNGALFAAIEPLNRLLGHHPRWGWIFEGTLAQPPPAAVAEGPGADVAASPHAVVVGHGPVGQTVTRLLREFGIRTTVIDSNVDTVHHLREAGHPAIFGDATRPDILEAAGLRQSRYLLVTIPHPEARSAVILAAREQHPGVKILVRAHYLREREWLEQIGVAAVSYEEAESAIALAEILLEEVGADAERIERTIDTLRTELHSGARTA